MKKLICCILTALLLLLPVGCAKPSVNIPVTVHGAIFGGAADDRIATDLTFDMNWLVKGDNTRYNRDLAAFSALLCADSYFRVKDVDKGTANRVLVDGANEEEYNIAALLKAAGFNEVEYLSTYEAQEYEADTNDSATLLMAHAAVEGKADVYAVVLRGCFSAGEWVSVFDLGADTDEYTTLTGAHSEWVDRDVHKGVDIAMRRAQPFIEDFRRKHDDPALTDVVLYTGHSRGAALANLLGAEAEAAGTDKTFTYTFNTPGSVYADTIAEAKTVFNIFDEGDFFTNVLPIGGKAPLRYGTDKTLSIAGDEKLAAAVTALKGREDYTCVSAEVREEYLRLFTERFPTRESLYTPVTITEDFEDAESAAARRDEIAAVIADTTGLGLESLCTLECDGTSVSLTYCPAALLQSFALTMAYGEAAHNYLVTAFRGDAEAVALADLLLENTGAINAGHLLANSYVVATAVK